MKLTSAQQTIITMLINAGGTLPSDAKGLKLSSVRKLVEYGLVVWSDYATVTDHFGRNHTNPTTITLVSK